MFFFGFNRLFRYPLKMNNITFLVTKVFYIIKKKLIKSFFLWRKNYQIIFNRKTLANLILNLSLIYRANKIERKDRNEIGQAKLTKLVSNFCTILTFLKIWEIGGVPKYKAKQEKWMSQHNRLPHTQPLSICQLLLRFLCSPNFLEIDFTVNGYQSTIIM